MLKIRHVPLFTPEGGGIGGTQYLRQKKKKMKKMKRRKLKIKKRENWPKI